MMRPSGKAFAGIIAALAIVVAGIASAVVLTGDSKGDLKGVSTAVITANVWVDPSGNDAACSRANPPVSFSNPCKTIDRGCQLAQGGVVAVKSGTYATPPNSRFVTGDCGAAGATDIVPVLGSDPAALVASHGWATFICGDGDSRDTVNSQLTATFDVNSNAHAYFKMPCAHWTGILLGEGGQTTYQTQNVIMDGWHVDGWEMAGSRNIWIRNIEDGANVACGDSSYPIQARCQDPGYGEFEAKWARANIWSVATTNGQGFIHQNSGVPARNILVDGLWEHDQQSKRSTGSDGGWHTGCWQIDNVLQAPLPTDNIVINNLHCERVAHIGPLVGDGTTGLTFQNSSVPCPVEPLDNNTGQWATPACQQVGFTLQSTTGRHANILVRYNDFKGTIRSGDAGDLTGKNVRFIGNIAPSSQCTAGVFYDYNVVQSIPPCGQNWILQLVYPVINSIPGVNCCASAPVTDWHLASSYPWANSITATGSDYTLGLDAYGVARTGGRTPGVDERDSGQPPPTTTTTTTTQPSTTTTTTSTTTTTTASPASNCPDGGTALTLSLLSQTTSTVTLGWTPPSGAIGYRFSSASTSKKSSTWDGTRNQAKFSKANWYCVEALAVLTDGGYPNG